MRCKATAATAAIFGYVTDRETMARRHFPDAYTDEDNVRVGWSAIKGDVRAWCETDKGGVHKARWGVGKRCQVARRIGVWTADVHRREWVG
jgi:hypothetical protein